MNERIVLDRHNLERLVVVMSATPFLLDTSVEFKKGYSCALEVLSAIAKEMPDVAHGPARGTAVDKWMDHMALCQQCSAGPQFCPDGDKLVKAARKERDH